MSKNSVTYKLANAGLYIGGIASLVYAVTSAHGEGVNYISDFAKQLIKPIIPVTVGGLYCIGRAIDEIKPRKKYTKHKS